jgi:hypothetical protein
VPLLDEHDFPAAEQREMHVTRGLPRAPALGLFKAPDVEISARFIDLGSAHDAD